MNSRTLTMVIDAEFDRPITPRLARDLYWIFQAFTAVLAVFAVIWLLVDAPNIALFFIGLILAPVAWLIATMTLRMCLEMALTIFDLHERVTHTSDTPSPERPPAIPPSFGNASQSKGGPR